MLEAFMHIGNNIAHVNIIGFWLLKNILHWGRRIKYIISIR